MCPFFTIQKAKLHDTMYFTRCINPKLIGQAVCVTFSTFFICEFRGMVSL